MLRSGPLVDNRSIPTYLVHLYCGLQLLVGYIMRLQYVKQLSFFTKYGPILLLQLSAAAVTYHRPLVVSVLPESRSRSVSKGYIYDIVSHKP